ncbi:MAG: alpha-L-fucosidase [Phycisphaerae bacterium]
MSKYALNKGICQRQVHLDFHTSALIPQVGHEFDPDEFARTIKSAHIDSVTVFAVCHHGLAYYPSKVQNQHPGLSCDLLGRQIEALHKQDIRCPIYITVAWNYKQANLRPEWKMVDKNGCDYQDSGAGFYAYLQFFNTQYEQLLQATTQEILKNYDVDGLFFDIVFSPLHNGGPYDDVSAAIRNKFGWEEPTDANAVMIDVYLRREFALRMNKLIRKINKNCTIFYNTHHQLNLSSALSLRDELKYQTHLEMESLPSGFWGYYHFPMLARMMQTLPVTGIGMTGKFQKMWGDFGGRKPLPALEYECFRSQALGFGNSVGDQLHPSGKICRSTYQLIGQVYRQTENAEAFYAGSQPVPQVGIISPGHAGLSRNEYTTSIEGTILMMEELHYECQLIDDKTPLEQYEIIVLPDTVAVDEAMAAKIKTYYRKNGKLMLSGKSGQSADGQWMLDFLPYQCVGTEPLYPTFLRYSSGLFADRIPMDEVMYEQGTRLRQDQSMAVWVKRVVPYFNRTANHFCSHSHSPPEKLSRFPAAISDNRIVAFADPIFHAYRKHGSEIYRLLVQKALEKLIGQTPFGYSLPRTVLQTVRHRGKDALITLLHYIPIRKCTSIDVVDERSGLGGLRYEIRTDMRPSSVGVYGYEEFLEIRSISDHYEIVLPKAEGRILLTIKSVLER